MSSQSSCWPCTKNGPSRHGSPQTEEDVVLGTTLSWPSTWLGGCLLGGWTMSIGVGLPRTSSPLTSRPLSRQRLKYKAVKGLTEKTKKQQQHHEWIFGHKDVKRCVRCRWMGGTWTQIAYDPRGEIGGSCRQNILRVEKYRKKLHTLEASYQRCIRKYLVSTIQELYLSRLIKIKHVS